MKNALELITRLQNEFDCRLSDEQILNYLNAFEKRLSIEVVKNTEFLCVDLNGEDEIFLDFYSKDIVSVYLNGKKLKKTSGTQAGYRADGKRLYIDIEGAVGSLKVEHIVFPEEYTTLNCASRDLLLAEGYDDLYIYHILSREALLENDVDRLNNYCLLYSEALNTFKADAQERNLQNGCATGVARFSKIW